MVAVTVGFFAVGVAYVMLCDRIVGPDEPEPVPDAASDTDAATAVTS